jgi:hypothetical protein
MRSSLGVVILFVSACGSEPTSPKPEKASPPAKLEKAEPVEKVEKAEPVEKVDEVEPKGPLAPAKGPLAAGIDPPSKPALLAVAKPTIPGELGLLAPMVEFGPRRFAAAIRSQPFAERLEYDVHALIVEASAATPPVWSVVGSIEVHELRDPSLADLDDPGLIPTTVHAEDYDDDGEPELLVRVRNDVTCPGGGPNEITTMILVDPGPTPSIALETELHHALGNGAAETKALLTHEDLNGDGHRDVRIQYTTTSEPIEGEAAEPPDVAENRWIWDAGRDAWSLQNEASGKPAYTRWGCDW